MQLQAANVLSWIAAVTFAYFTNRKYVFESKNEKRLPGSGGVLWIASDDAAAGYVLYVPDGDTDGME